MPRQPLPCSTPSKQTQCGERQPWDQSPREHPEPGVVTGALRLIREKWATSGGLAPVPSAHFAVAKSNVPKLADCRLDPILRPRFRGATRPGDFRILGPVKVENRTQRMMVGQKQTALLQMIRLQGTLDAGRLPILLKTRPQLRMSPSSRQGSTSESLNRTQRRCRRRVRAHADGLYRRTLYYLLKPRPLAV